MKSPNAIVTTRAVAMTSRHILYLALPIAFVAMAYCDAAFAFSGNWTYSWGDTKFSHADMGTTENRTCFLSGVAGDLRTPSNGQSGVSVDIINGKYNLSVSPGAGGELRAFARCVNTAAGRTGEVTWSTIDKSSKLVAAFDPSHPLRRCFLTGITVSSAYEGTPEGFLSNTDYVQIWQDLVSKSWYIGSTSQSGTVYAKASCVDVNKDVGSWLSFGTQNLSNVYGATCFLTGIQGQFAYDDWDDGAFIDYNPGANQFFMNIKNGKHAWSTCVL